MLEPWPDTQELEAPSGQQGNGNSAIKGMREPAQRARAAAG